VCQSRLGPHRCTQIAVLRGVACGSGVVVNDIGCGWHPGPPCVHCAYVVGQGGCTLSRCASRTLAQAGALTLRAEGCGSGWLWGGIVVVAAPWPTMCALTLWVRVAAPWPNAGALPLPCCRGPPCVH
jgi:hypothetical protein